MFMKKITAIIGIASDGGYSVYCEDEMFAGMGDTREKGYGGSDVFL